MKLVFTHAIQIELRQFAIKDQCGLVPRPSLDRRFPDEATPTLDHVHTDAAAQSTSAIGCGQDHEAKSLCPLATGNDGVVALAIRDLKPTLDGQRCRGIVLGQVRESLHRRLRACAVEPVELKYRCYHFFHGGDLWASPTTSGALGGRVA